MRAAIYIRVSTTDQVRDGYSLAMQERELREYCKGKNHEVVAVYRDEGISGKDIKHRPGMLQLFDIILVWSLSRFSRSVADLYQICDDLDKKNISLVSHTEQFDTTTVMGRAMLGIIAVFAQMEREITGDRVRAAMQERAVQGKRTCHEVLGYDKLGADSFTINPKEAEMVQYIYSKFLEYRNLSAVAELCRLKGYRGKRGRVPGPWSVKVILSRPIYAGYNSFCGELYKGLHPAIVSEQDFNKVQWLLNQPQIVGRPRKQK